MTIPSAQVIQTSDWIETMKTTVFVLLFNMVFAFSAFGRTPLEEMSLDSLSAIYGEMLEENLSHVEASGT